MLRDIGKPMEDWLSDAISAIVPWLHHTLSQVPLMTPQRSVRHGLCSWGDRSTVSSGSPTHRVMKDQLGLISTIGSMETKLIIIRGE